MSEIQNLPKRKARQPKKKRFFLDKLNENERFGRIINVPLSYLSATTVVGLLTFMAVAFLLTGQPDVITFTVVFAIAILAYGWRELVDSPSRNGALATIALVGISNTLLIRLTYDLAWAGISIALSVLIAAIVEMLRPLPRPRLIESISASVFGALVAVVGSGWVALESSQLWSTILLACSITVAGAVIGNQFGTTLKGNAFGAVAAGTLSGAALGGIALLRGAHHQIVHLSFSAFTDAVNPILGIFMLTCGLGFALGLVIALVDALFGDYHRNYNERGAFARGAMKFLLAVLPIYILIRTGAF